MEPPCRAPDVALTELYDGGRETQGDGCGWSEEVRTSLGLLGPWSWRPHTFREQGRSKACLRGVRSRRKISSRMVVILALVVSGTMALAQSLNESQNISEIVRNDTESNITEAEERDVEEESLQQRPEPGAERGGARMNAMSRTDAPSGTRFQSSSTPMDESDG